MDCENPAVRPITNVERTLVCRGKARTSAKNDRCRGSKANINDTRKCVEVLSRKSASPAAPSEIGPGNDVEHTIGHVPRSADVQLHICIEREHLARFVEGNVQWVAHSHGKHLDIGTIRIE